MSRREHIDTAREEVGMHQRTARRLARLTSDFYAQVASSFSATRERAWPGWERLLAEVDLPWLDEGRSLQVLDLACGNLRFERFLAERLLGAGGSRAACELRIHAIDGCDELAGARPLASAGVTVSYTHLDVAELLLSGGDLARQLGPRVCDLSVCLAFLHHLALPEQRERVLDALVGVTRPGGFVAISFWQLSQSDRLLARARATTEEARTRLGLDDLGEGDYVLGWQGRTDVLRFCHDFSEEEIDALSASVRPRAREQARFSADGTGGNLNRYLVLRVES